jgi:hypothetical protein
VGSNAASAAAAQTLKGLLNDANSGEAVDDELTTTPLDSVAELLGSCQGASNTYDLYSLSDPTQDDATVDVTSSNCSSCMRAARRSTT